MGPNTWYWSERLLRSRNHAAPGWPNSTDGWRYVGVTHEAYIHPVRTLSSDLFINYIGDTDVSKLQKLPEPVAGSFYISHDAEKTEQKSRQRLRQDVQLLENYLNKDDAHLDAWQHSRAVFYLAQSHRSLGHLEVAKNLWERYLSSKISSLRQFSYLRYGSHMGLGQICSESPDLFESQCLNHFEEAHRLCPRAEPMVYLALALPSSQKKARVKALERAKEVQHLEASTGHCAVYAEESVYRQIDTLLAQEKKGPRCVRSLYMFCSNGKSLRYLTSPGRCEKRHFYEDITKDDDALSRDIFFKDAQGTNLYVKLTPAADPPAFEWKAIIGILAPSSGKILEKDTPAMSFGSCRDLCARSRFCNCFAFSNVSSICDRYFNCQSSQVVPDSRYKVYYKVGPLHEDSEPWALKWIMMVLLLSCVCASCLVFASEEGRRRGEPMHL
eukprot:symbB.v1.2.015671.t1/scaffold1178.1/size133623/4